VCLWNIHGAIITKLETHEHLLDLFQHVDVVALSETHHFPGNTFPVLSRFSCFDVAKPVTPQGVVQKHSGGIVVLVRETWANNTAVWNTTRDGTRIWLRLGNAFQRPLFLCIVYAAPQGSPYADSSLFDHICQEVGEAMSLGSVLLAGDFNAKTSTNTDFIDCNQLADVLLVPHAIENTLPNDMLERQNRDTVTAGWHREFLDLYRTTGLFILNGRTPRDISREYTCLSNKSFSTMDYFLMTTNQFEGVKGLEVNNDEKYSGHKDAHSDHRPLVLTITQQWQPPPVQQKVIKHLPHFKYDIAKSAEFSKSVQHNIGVWASPDVLDTSDVQTIVNLLQ
jgi:exonuclease III